MENKKIIFPELFFTDKNLVGRDVCKISRNLSDLKGIFADVEAFEKMPQDKLAYEVSSFLPEKEGTPGGLYFGITYLYPGKVGNEYMMTLSCEYRPGRILLGLRGRRNAYPHGRTTQCMGRASVSRQFALYSGRSGSPDGKCRKFSFFICSLLAFGCRTQLCRNCRERIFRKVD